MPKAEDRVLDLQDKIEAQKDEIEDLKRQVDEALGEVEALLPVVLHARHCYQLWMEGELTRQNGMMELDRLLREVGR